MTFSGEFLKSAEEDKSVDGFSHLVYIRPAAKGETGFAVCSVDGRQLAVFPNYDAAFFTARQYNLAPVSVH